MTVVLAVDPARCVDGKRGVSSSNGKIQKDLVLELPVGPDGVQNPSSLFAYTTPAASTAG